MQPHQDSLLTQDGLRLYYRLQLPADQPRAVVLILHGLCEHGGRYVRLAGAMTKAGYLVCIPDLRGHGGSEGPRAVVERFEEYVDDADRLLARIQLYHPSCPVFVVGHSMGGLIALHLAVRRRPNLDGLILSAPAIEIASNVFPWMRRFTWLAERWFPRARLLRLGSSKLSKDKTVVQEFRNDPLVHHEAFPVQTGIEILRAGRQIRDGAVAVRPPLLILHGMDDCLVDPMGSQWLHARAGSTQKLLQLYPHVYHDLFHEPEHPTITTTVLEWIERLCDEKPSGIWNPDVDTF